MGSSDFKGSRRPPVDAVPRSVERHVSELASGGRHQAGRGVCHGGPNPDLSYCDQCGPRVLAARVASVAVRVRPRRNHKGGS